MADFVETMMDQVQSALYDAALDAMAPLQSAIQARVGKPVERTGGKVIRSKPGEPPRKDTGRLQSEVNVAVLEGSDTVRVSLSVGVPYAPRLNNEMDRPIAGDEPAKHLDGMVDFLAERLSASNPR